MFGDACEESVPVGGVTVVPEVVPEVVGLEDEFVATGFFLGGVFVAGVEEIESESEFDAFVEGFPCVLGLSNAWSDLELEELILDP